MQTELAYIQIKRDSRNTSLGYMLCTAGWPCQVFHNDHVFYFFNEMEGRWNSEMYTGQTLDN